MSPDHQNAGGAIAPELTGRVAIVTGAARGIGLAVAEQLAEAGADLVLNDLDEGIESLGRGRRVVGDVSEPATAAALAAKALEAYGRIDILVNNAGISPHQPIVDHPDETWHRSLAVNLTGPFYCCRAVVPAMLAQGRGRIVNIASQMGLIGAEGYGAYCASKGGLITLTKALARELAPSGILVNCVAPGPVETDMLITDSPEYSEATRLALPLRRWGQPIDIAASVRFLCGPGGDYYAGQVLSPNGGSVI